MKRSCPNCHAKLVENATFCGHCGLKLPPPIKYSKKWWIIGGVALCAWGLIVAYGIATFDQRVTKQTTTPASLTAQSTPNTSSSPTASSSTATVTPGEHLVAARKALAEGYQPNKDPMKTTWGHITEAQEHLSAIHPSDKEYPQAQKLRDEINRRLASIERLSKMGARQLVVKDMERKMLSQGMDFEFTVSGPEKDRLTVKYVLMSRPLVYKLTVETDFLNNMKESGFKKVILTDGYNDSWSYDL